MGYRAAQQALGRLGIPLDQQAGLFRLTYPAGGGGIAYETADLQDAIATGHQLAEWLDQAGDATTEPGLDPD